MTQDTTEAGQVRMSIERLSQINRFLGIILIAMYFALALSFLPDLLPGSAIGLFLTGSGQR
jgi:hypothetical protein